eukprot:Pgem_evm1s17673
MQQCCINFDFCDPVADLKGKETKRQMLKDLTDHIKLPGVITERVYPNALHM